MQHRVALPVLSWTLIGLGIVGCAFGIIWLLQPTQAVVLTHTGPWWVAAYLVFCLAVFIAVPVILLVKRHRVLSDSRAGGEGFRLARMTLYTGVLETLLGVMIWLATLIILSGATQHIRRVQIH